MKIRYGPFVGALSGSEGNTTASRNKGGPYLRIRSMPTKRVTPYTTEIRGRLASLSQAWGSVDPSDQAAWEAFAPEHPIIDRLGDSRTLQASNLFIQLNMRLLGIGASQISLPPIATPPGAIDDLTLTVQDGAGVCELAWTSGALPADEQLVIWSALLTSPGRRYYKNLLTQVAYSPISQASPFSFKTQQIDRKGDLLVGQRMYVHAFVYSNVTGFSSALAVANTTVVAAP